jgi:hypothetical protein
MKRMAGILTLALLPCFLITDTAATQTESAEGALCRGPYVQVANLGSKVPASIW